MEWRSRKPTRKVRLATVRLICIIAVLVA